MAASHNTKTQYSMCVENTGHNVYWAGKNADTRNLKVTLCLKRQQDSKYLVVIIAVSGSVPKNDRSCLVLLGLVVSQMHPFLLS